MRFLHRFGGEFQVGEMPAAAVIVGIGVGPQLLHDRDTLVGERAALPKGDAQRRKLLGHRPDAHSQRHPATGHVVQGGSVLGELDRIMVG